MSKDKKKLSDWEKIIMQHELDHVLDDHGLAIIGSREKAPIDLNTNQSVKIPIKE